MSETSLADIENSEAAAFNEDDTPATKRSSRSLTSPSKRTKSHSFATNAVEIPWKVKNNSLVSLFLTSEGHNAKLTIKVGSLKPHTLLHLPENVFTKAGLKVSSGPLKPCGPIADADQMAVILTGLLFIHNRAINTNLSNLYKQIEYTSSITYKFTLIGIVIDGNDSNLINHAKYFPFPRNIYSNVYLSKKNIKEISTKYASDSDLEPITDAEQFLINLLFSVKLKNYNWGNLSFTPTYKVTKTGASIVLDSFTADPTQCSQWSSSPYRNFATQTTNAYIKSLHTDVST